jgi:hypothetical protein
MTHRILEVSLSIPKILNAAEPLPPHHPRNMFIDILRVKRICNIEKMIMSFCIREEECVTADHDQGLGRSVATVIISKDCRLGTPNAVILTATGRSAHNWANPLCIRQKHY